MPKSSSSRDTSVSKNLCPLSTSLVLNLFSSFSTILHSVEFHRSASTLRSISSSSVTSTCRRNRLKNAFRWRWLSANIFSILVNRMDWLPRMSCVVIVLNSRFTFAIKFSRDDPSCPEKGDGLNRVGLGVSYSY